VQTEHNREAAGAQLRACSGPHTKESFLKIR
jgi:hypothetical protein